MGTFDSKTKSALSAFFANHAVTVERKNQSGTSPTGEPLSTTGTVYSGLVCQIEQVSGQGMVQATIEGVIYTQTHTLVLDGLSSSQVIGQTIGSTIIVSGISYIVAPQLRGAFVDIQPNDRITDQAGRTYLVIDTGNVTDILPHTQARLAQGKAW